MPASEDATAAASGRESSRISPAFIPDHELLRRIGEGSYGEVWLARNTLGAFRAVKIVREKTFRHRKPFDREYNGVQKFEPVSRLHDGLVDILHVGRNDTSGYFYCVMELADDVANGPAIDPEHYAPRTLAHDLTRRKRLPIAECRRIGVAIASALKFLHGRGLIHRDIKPANIVFVDGVPKLADIGLVADAADARSYVGTEGFIPPEGPGTVLADIYSLGKVLYEISTGKDRQDYPEFPTELSDGIEQGQIFEFNKVVLKACRADPGQRYKAAAEMAVDILALGDRGGRGAVKGVGPGRKHRVGVAAILGLGMVSGLLLLAWNGDRPGRTGLQASPGGKNRKQTSGQGLGFPGLVGRWRGENSTEDAVSGNRGTVAGTNGVSYGSGVAGQAFVFDGTHRDRVDLGNPPNLRLQDFTIEAWIKRSSPTNISFDNRGRDGSVCGNGGAIFSYGAGGYGLTLTDRGQLSLGSMDLYGVFSRRTIADTNWHHVAATRWGKVVEFYIDGVAEAVDYDYPFGFTFKSAVAIGSRGDALGATFYGMIDEIAIYNRALTAREVQAAFNGGSPGKYERTLKPVPVGPAALWPAEGSPCDLVGGNCGVEHGSVKYAPGVIGQAFSFDGNDSFLEVPDNPSLHPTNAITVECWINRRAPIGKYDPVLIKPGTASAAGYTLEFLGDGIAFWVANGTPVASASATLEYGRWYHVAGVYDGTNVLCYVNGRTAGDPVVARGALGASGNPLYVGMNGSKPDRLYCGLVDEVTVYDRALSAEEIEADYLTGGAAAGSLAAQRERSR